MGRLNASISRLVLAALAVVITVAVFSPALQNGFVYDDHVQVLKNPWITDIRFLPEVFSSSSWAFFGYSGNTYRPMLHIYSMATYFVFGLRPSGWHLVNILVHAANAVLVFLTASLLIKNRADDTLQARKGGFAVLTPFFAALIFSLHPVNSEPVAWVTAVAELAFTFFLLLSMYLYLRFREGGGKDAAFYALSLASFVIAVFSKETAFALPALIVASDLSSGRGLKYWRSYAGYFAVAALYMAARTLVVGALVRDRQVDLSGVELVINVLPLVFQYAKTLAYPSSLSALYELHTIKTLDARAAAGIAVIAAFLAALVVFRRRRAVFLGLIMMGLPLLPVLYIPALSTSAAADRYMYLPTAGLGIIAAYVFERVFNGNLRRAFTYIVAAIVITVLSAYSISSVERTRVWRDDLALWSDTVRKSPGSRYAHYNLALAYQDRGYLDNAIAEFKAAIKAAPDYEDAHYNLAWCYQSKGDSINAAIHYREVLRLDPGGADAHYNLGLIYRNEALFVEAAFEFREALRLKPGYAEAGEALAKITGAVGVGSAR